MPTDPNSTSAADALFSDPAFLSAVRDLVARVTAASKTLEGPKVAADREPARALAKRIQNTRGRALFFDGIVGSGLGRGALAEMADGTTKLDFITAIGTNFFGHSDPDMLETALKAAVVDVAMQGNLHPNREYLLFLETILANAPGRMKKAWLAASGADANENALKMARQKRNGARIVVAFEHNFAGRTTTMAEITDVPGYRKGQPHRGEVLYIPFFDPKDPAASIERSDKVFRSHLHRFGDEICAIMMELVQGEGGVNAAPKEFFERLMKTAKAAGIPVWIDEIQTFGRTREMFATQMMGVAEYVDLITVGKLVQTACTLYTDEMTPDNGLLSGTFSGSTVSLALGRRVMERLVAEGHYGADGRNAKIEKKVLALMNALANGRCKGMLHDPVAVGTMCAFVPFDGSAEAASRLQKLCWEHGVILFNAGHEPSKIRMLLPGGAVTDADLETGFTRIGDALEEMARERAAAAPVQAKA